MRPDEWDERYRGTGSLWSLEPNRFVVEVCQPLAPGRALDLAAGEGRNALWLAARSWAVTALDFSPVAVDRARQRADAAGVTLRAEVVDVVDGWRPDPETADLVLLAYLQLPADDLTGVLRRAATALAPGGTLLFVAHDRRNLHEGHGGPSEAAVLADTTTVTAALDGLDVTRAEVADRPVDTPDGPRTALDTLVVAHRPR